MSQYKIFKVNLKKMSINFNFLKYLDNFKINFSEDYKILSDTIYVYRQNGGGGGRGKVTCTQQFNSIYSFTLLLFFKSFLI